MPMSTTASAGHKGLYLPGVEQNLKPGIYKTLVDSARARNAEYSRIWDLFAFQPAVTRGLSDFTEGVMRCPASISLGMRELIAAWTSRINECRFCTAAHAAAAAEHLGGEELVRSVLDEMESSPLDQRDKAMLRYIAKVTHDLPSVGEADVEQLRAVGWDDEAIYYAITTCALFNFYNRWITATGVAEMSAAAHRAQGQGIARKGYIRKDS